jgi:hypothetical protein
MGYPPLNTEQLKENKNTEENCLWIIFLLNSKFVDNFFRISHPKKVNNSHKFFWILFAEKFQIKFARNFFAESLFLSLENGGAMNLHKINNIEINAERFK